MQVTISATSIGGNAGPFDIYQNFDTYTTPVATGVSRASILAGYVATINDATTTVRLTSSGTCTNSTDISVISPSPTPSVTPSVTPSITISPSATPSISISATPSVTPSISISATPSVTPSISISATPSVTPSISISKTPSVTPSTTPPADTYNYNGLILESSTTPFCEAVMKNRQLTLRRFTIYIQDADCNAITSHPSYTFEVSRTSANNGTTYEYIVINNGSSSNYVVYTAVDSCDTGNVETMAITSVPSGLTLCTF